MRAWMPGVTALPSSHDGGSMTGSDPYAVWHSYEAPYQLTALQAARSLIAAGNEVQGVFHPITGDIVQILPADRAGRGLRNSPGGVQTNRQGRVCFQIEVIAYARRPWTEDLTPAGRRGLARLVAYLRELGVPDIWPAGPPPAYPTGSDPRSVRLWNGPGGHFSHSQIPENTHGDPGAIDTRALFATTSEEDDMPDAADLWGYKVPRPNNTPASAGGQLGAANVNAYRAWQTSLRVLGEVTALTAMLQELKTTGGQTDLTELRKIAEESSVAAMRKVAAEIADGAD